MTHFREAVVEMSNCYYHHHQRTELLACDMKWTVTELALGNVFNNNLHSVGEASGVRRP